MENKKMEWIWDDYDESRAKRAVKVKISSIDGDTATVCGDKPGDTYITTLTSCSCQDFRFNLRGKKPCKHIIALGIALGLLNDKGYTPDMHLRLEIRDTVEKIARAAGYYYVFGEYVISDEEYDSLKAYLAELTEIANKGNYNVT